MAGPRVAIGALMQESNARCLDLADIRDFENNYLVFGEDVVTSCAAPDRRRPTCAA